MSHFNVLQGENQKILATLKEESVACVVTSPPYFRCRTYGDSDGEVGRENTPSEFIENLCQVFFAVWRVLRDDGVLWVNIGDSIADKNYGAKAPFPAIYKGEQMMIPTMFALAMRRSGWLVQQDIIWAKTNLMPCSTPKRCTPSHEYIFMFTKGDTYKFDPEAIMVPAKTNFKGKKQPPIGGVKRAGGEKGSYSGNTPDGTGMAHKRDVWFETTSECKEVHFVPFPETIVEPCILATTAPGDFVMDPFAGTGTTGVVALKNDRLFVGIELYAKYVDMIKTNLGEVSSKRQKIEESE